MHKDFKGEQLAVLYATAKKKAPSRVYPSVSGSVSRPRERSPSPYTSVGTMDKKVAAGEVQDAMRGV